LLNNRYSHSSFGTTFLRATAHYASRCDFFAICQDNISMGQLGRQPESENFDSDEYGTTSFRQPESENFDSNEYAFTF
jgi:hypothetical protein